MDKEFLIVALVAISLFTSLATEGIKKLLDEAHSKYASNLLVSIVAVVLTIAASVGYIIYTGEVVTGKIIVEIIAMVFLSFLTATCGYDKVLQAIAQIKRG